MSSPKTDDIPFGREKRLLLAWLALLAPLPLPFSEVLEWPVLFLYAVAIVYFLQRVEGGRPPSLPTWALNALGLAYLPLLVVDLRASFLRGRVVAALLHLVMFLVLVKLYSMRRDAEKWHLTIAIFFLFLGGMATATHMTVSLYLLGFMALALVVLGRFAHLHAVVRGGQGRGRGGQNGARAAPRQVPFRSPLVAGMLVVLLVAIPTFATIPRLRDPYILGPGSGSGGLIRTTGFSDSVDLSLTSSIRASRDIVLRLKFSGDDFPDGADLRFKGAVYDRYEDDRWHRLMDHAERLDRGPSGLFRLFEEGTSSTVEIFRERLNSSSLLLPMEAVSIEADFAPTLAVDPGGGVFLPFAPRDTVRYKVGLAEEPRFRARLDRLDGRRETVAPLTALDQGGLSDRMRRLAREVMGEEGDPAARIARLEDHLLREYTYSLDFLGAEGDAPLEDFLFVDKSGHCELFASAMVLLLRAEGVPARLSTGFLGAEYNPLEGYFMVRQENAHAWVEAFVPGEGWRVYDPTPPEGRPVVPERNLKQFMSQLYDYLTFRWDRWILTFGADDQRGLFESLRERLAALWERLRGVEEISEESSGERITGSFEASDERIREDDLWLSRVPLAVTAGLFILVIVGLILWRRRRGLDVATTYLVLRRHLERLEPERADDTLAPFELRDLVAERYPAALYPAGRLVELYVRERFADQPLTFDERRDLSRLERDARKAIRRIAEERERAAKPRSTDRGSRWRALRSG